MMEKDNRKSHLAPQLSPSTQDLLRTSDSPTYQGDGGYTPTSGEIPIAGAISSPRDPAGHSQNRSPTRNGLGSLGRAGGAAAHPGLGQRSATATSVPRVGTPDKNLPASASQATFTLPVRSGAGGAMPPPPRKETPDELRKDNRRQAAFLPPSNGGYSNAGYPTK